jgi:hypothetical protein
MLTLNKTNIGWARKKLYESFMSCAVDLYILKNIEKKMLKLREIFRWK